MHTPSAYQLVQTLSPGDAISGHALGLSRLLAERGYRTSVLAERLHPRALGLGGLARELERRRHGPDDLLVYHYSLDSDLTPIFAQFPGRRVLVYHNVTPERFLVGFHPELVEFLARGREALARLRGVPHFSLADSEWNRKELEQLGFHPTATLPVLVDFKRLDVPPDPLTARWLRRPGTRVLFVGRVIPNKGHHALVRCFAAYQRLFDPRARLLVAGEFRSIERYNHELLRLTAESGARNVEFLGHVSDAALAALYRAADLFVCLSRHEGFCVPLLEAFAFGVPVLALARTAVPDTCGNAAVLVEQDDPLLVAGLMDALVRDVGLRRSVLEGQRRRLEDFRPDRIAACLDELLPRLLNAEAAA
jgi:glycosyltransferase involved in cell wall biosynthesis